MSANPAFVYEPPMDPYLEIIYQDEDIVVLNKQSGLLSVTGRLPEHQDCLQTRVCRVFPTATIVHRLDMATSGIIIMALNKPSHVSISRQFEQRQTEKYYIARVLGHIKEPIGEITLPLICDWPNRPIQMVCYERGKQAQTHYQVLSQDKHTTLVKLKPVTGRTHQLRVHMRELGHPIMGDRLYAPKEATKGRKRMSLHSQFYAIFHPRTGERIEFDADCPFE
ncbi:pseudouridine synthase [Thalassotalea psychrophila]|uniref:Dual-specificity RNA pseudouridine synthase RluA n=1 Tax=Thalassotalea psychrophila TaxID=3065647 RepID=A0ABY9TWK1_9GAMM|nr:pseudouridine synthase [Colwelliaceae bacterium SQ149]